MLANFIPVWYSHGMRGNAIYRILSAHPEAYWYTTDELDNSLNPLYVPSNITSIEGLAYGNDIAARIGMWKMGYTTYHTVSLFKQAPFNKVLYAWLNNRDKILFPLLSPKYKKENDIELLDYSTYKDLNISINRYKLVDPSNPHIWVYGTRNRLNMTKAYFEPSPHPSAYNLNMNNLFSTDYSTFETEYYNLIAHFNLTSCLNNVRAFILLVLERETYISKFY